MAELTLDANGALDVDSFYCPLPKQQLLHTNVAKNLLGIGGNYSGKSLFLIGEAVYTALEYPGAQTLLLRKNFPELEKGLIRDFLDTVPRELYKYDSSKHVATFHSPEGTNAKSKIFFGHCKSGSEKDLSQYLSAAFVWIGIDELGQFSFEAYNFMTSRNRVNKGCQPNAEGFMPICRMGGATNPFGPGYGWVKKLWVEHKPVSQLGKTFLRDDGIYYSETHGGEVPVYDPKQYFFVHSTILDNPYALERDPDAINKLMALAPALRQKALYGDLNAIAGTYFQNFTQEHHVMSLPRDRDRIKWEHWQPIWISIDWGLAHHSVIYWHTYAKILASDGVTWRSKVVTFRQLIVKEMSHRELCKEVYMSIWPSDTQKRDEEIKRTKHLFLSPERFARATDPDSRHTVANEMGDEFKKYGLPHPMRAADRRVDGAVFLYNLIDADEWVILDVCEELISALETRVRDEKNLEDVEKVEDIGDDCYDSARYGLYSMLKEKGKPKELVFAEKLASIPDHTGRMVVAYEQYLKDQEPETMIAPRLATRWLRKR